ncbi:helix-turn-helix domain-containing protein [Achromobacter insuavis]
MAQVAADVGFYDQSHFNRAFRTAYGVPPSAYRRAA